MSNKNCTILIVDDEPLLESLFLQTFEEAITNNEFQFIFAENGIKALEAIERNPEIGIVFTDINMPEMDGLTLLARLSKQQRLFCTVVISAYDDMHNIRTAMNNGASDFITKPIDLSDLEITLKKTVSQYLAMHQSLADKRKILEIQTELNIASSIQRAFLPNDFSHFSNNELFTSDSLVLYGEMLPAKEIGGDFFDFFPLKNNQVGIIIADVSGKSISAALFMAISMSLIRAVAGVANSPSECMQNVNRLLQFNNESCMFVTVFYAIIDPASGALHYCNAGHNPPFIVSQNGEINRLEHAGIALGVSEDWLEKVSLYQDHSLPLKKGDMLVLYTDGVTEALSPNLGFYGEKRFVDCIKKNSHLPIKEFVQSIQQDIQNFSGDAERADDITIFAIQFSP